MVPSNQLSHEPWRVSEQLLPLTLRAEFRKQFPAHHASFQNSFSTIIYLFIITFSNLPFLIWSKPAHVTQLKNDKGLSVMAAMGKDMFFAAQRKLIKQEPESLQKVENYIIL